MLLILVNKQPVKKEQTKVEKNAQAITNVADNLNHKRQFLRKLKRN